MTKKISIVIPVYNRTDELRKTLDSLTVQTLPNNQFEVIIADDGSAEDIKTVLQEYPKLQIKYTYQPDEGYRVAAARNLGADIAEGEIIVFSDNGIVLSTSALERHVANHHANGESFVVLGNMYATASGINRDRALDILENNDIDTAITMLKSENITDGREPMFIRDGEDVSSWFIPWQAFWGGHFSVNSAFVKKHSIRFNESFTFWGCEDIEYGIQLYDAGAVLCFCRDVAVAHYPEPSSIAIKELTDEEWKEKHTKPRMHIVSLYPGRREIEAWVELGGRINTAERRAKYYKNKGWEVE